LKGVQEKILHIEEKGEECLYLNIQLFGSLYGCLKCVFQHYILMGKIFIVFYPV